MAIDHNYRSTLDNIIRKVLARVMSITKDHNMLCSLMARRFKILHVAALDDEQPEVWVKRLPL